MRFNQEHWGFNGMIKLIKLIAKLMQIVWLTQWWDI